MDERTCAAVEQAVRIFAREAGRQALEFQHGLRAASKDGEALIASNIVTEADRQIGRFAEEFLARLFPGAVVIQEETVDQVGTAALSADTLVFVVDPIDGTLFYANRSWAWAISVGAFWQWEPIAGCVYAPQVGDLYCTEGDATLLNDVPVRARAPEGELKGAVMLRHIKAYHTIDRFPGYTLSYGSVALHLAMVAAGTACACVTSRHYPYDVAGAAKLLENAGAELRYVSGGDPSWRELLQAPNRRAPDFFFACPKGQFDRLSEFVEVQFSP